MLQIRGDDGDVLGVRANITAEDRGTTGAEQQKPGPQ
jgi:hypothetical protein